MPNKKILKDIHYMEIDDQSGDIGVTVNGVNLVNLDRNVAHEILRANGLMSGKMITLPAGLRLTSITQHGGALEYDFNDGFIKVDLVFDDDDEDEYIG